MFNEKPSKEEQVAATRYVCPESASYPLTHLVHLQINDWPSLPSSTQQWAIFTLSYSRKRHAYVTYPGNSNVFQTPKAVENFTVHSRNRYERVIMLIYDDIHLSNNHSYFNGHLFHRVIKSFMVQTGDPLGKRVHDMLCYVVLT